MVFSSLTFLYYFLPIFLVVYFLTPMPNGSPRLRNVVLLLASLVFYAWGEPVYILLLLIQCISAWGLGLLIEKYRGKAVSRTLMIISVVISLSALLFFKYADFLFPNINSIFNLEIGLLALAQHSDVEKELSERKHNAENIALGIRRFIIGLGKKVLIANLMAEIVGIYRVSQENSVLFSWLYIIAVSMQIYFDFSGYSDMAIGLGYIMGFKFMENFNYPFISQSITDFWRRWHISLSSWFKDYVYIPLGGSRKSLPRYIFNVILVWFLTGFWHSADWYFITWGLYFAAFLLIERFLLSKFIEKVPRFFRHAYVLIFVLIGMAFVGASNIADVSWLRVIPQMFGFSVDSIIGSESLYYLRSYLVPLIIGIFACTPIPKNIVNKLSTRKIFIILEPLALGILLLVVTAFLVDGSFNPFIYYRF